jgi:hypothetical protein
MGGKATGGTANGNQHGPDNNKRLAQLEAGVSALAMALAANGIELTAEQDPIEQAIAIVKRWRELTLARAELQIAVATAVGVEPETIEDPFAAAGGALETMKAHIGESADAGELAAAKARVTELEAEVEELNHDVEDAINERNTLRNALSEAGKGSAAAAVDQEAEAEAPPAIELVRGENARDVGPSFGVLTADEIGSAVEEGARFEVAFSNGEFELEEFGPIYVNATDLHRFATAQWSVAPTIHIKGASVPMEIAGAGLLLEGVQIGWCAFDPVTRIEPGQERAFNRALIF